MSETSSNSGLESEFVELVGKVLKGSHSEAKSWIRTLEKRLRRRNSNLAEAIREQMTEASRSTSSRPKSPESAFRFRSEERSGSSELLQISSAANSEAPVLESDTTQDIQDFLEAWHHREELLENGLEPPTKLLFIGPPGVGKTMTARWVASHLGLPLATLDLASVISSYLGRTGSNIKNVLDYGRRRECVLFIDEFDSVGKKRSDAQDVGELKRLVNVLLQSIDDWSSEGILIAATNHPEILDRAIWRRFDEIVEFRNPTPDSIGELLEIEVGGQMPSRWLPFLRSYYKGESHSMIRSDLKRMKRNRIVRDASYEKLVKSRVEKFSNRQKFSDERRKEIALALRDCDLTQRDICDQLSMSRNTIRDAEATGYGGS